MSIQAVIFDVYGTLLEVGSPPSDAEARWQELCRDMLGIEPPLTRLGLSVAWSRVIAREHDAARVRGIPWPEVHWPSVVTEVLPPLARLSPSDQAEFLLRQIQTGHTTHMTTETAAALRRLKGRPVSIGIASNAQAYTLRELEQALGTHALGMDLFEPDLRFWSFEHGFSKPDPHVFQILTARLAARGVSPSGTLMVGDRLDNDLQPAQAMGWLTWHLTPSPTPDGKTAGDWSQFGHRWLDSSL